MYHLIKIYNIFYHLFVIVLEGLFVTACNEVWQINRQNAKRNNSCILLAICTKSLFVYEDTFAIAFKLFYNILKIVRIYCRVFERA